MLPTYIVKTRQWKMPYLRLEDEAWEKMAESLDKVLAATAAGGDVVLEASVTLTGAVTLITLAPAAPQHAPLITHSPVQSR